MAQPDHLIVVQPGQGRRSGDVEFLATSDDTPRLVVCTILLDPWSRGVEAHVHQDEDDAFYVLEGELTFEGRGGAVRAPAGSFVLAPAGVEHGLRNETGEPVRILKIHAP